MNTQLLKDALGWGFGLWLIGYALGIVLFFFVPVTLVGWIVMPIGLLVAIWVLLEKMRSESLRYYLVLALTWTVIAVVCDYFLLVNVFKPADGYYKLDVYVYYAFTLVLTPGVGWSKGFHGHKSTLDEPCPATRSS